MVTAETFAKATSTAAASDRSPQAPPQAVQSEQGLATSRKPDFEDFSDETEIGGKLPASKTLRDAAKPCRVARAGIEPATHGFSI
jgi:hypothetical protein